MHGNAARNFARVVAAHAVGQYHEADLRIGADGVFVVITNTAGIRHLSEVYFSLQAHLRNTNSSCIGL